MSCQAAASPTTTPHTSAPTNESSTTRPPSNTSSLTSSTTPPEVPSLPAEDEVRVPDGPGPFPAIVLVHGGAWVVGTPLSIEPLAIYLSENGYLTVNASYKLALQSPGFPDAFDDIACAVRLAASHPMSDGTVTIIGHSAGAHVGAVVALTGSEYAADCPLPGDGVPDRFIGLGGPYDVSRLGPIMVNFFGSEPDAAPEDWKAGNPQLQARINTGPRSLLIHGDIDQVVPVDFTTNFYDALIAAGSDAKLIILEGVEHAGARDPSIVGELILEWLAP